jgi:hypothetical protein
MCLARLLGLKDPHLTRSFGNTSKALPFNAKLNLFLDLEGVSKEEAEILIKFSEIRNKFAHRQEINSIYDCLEPEKDKSLKKFFENRYKSKIENYQYNEENVRLMFPLFLDDLEMTCGAILMRMFEKITDEVGVLTKSKKLQFLIKNFTDYKEFTQDELLFVKRILEKTKQQHKEYDFTDEVIALI